MLGSILSAIGGAGMSMWRDLWSMKRADDYKEWLADREDTAVQRRAKDMEAAGLSKTLAAGSAASAGAVSMPEPKGGALQDALTAANQFQQNLNAREENANLRTTNQVLQTQVSNNVADTFMKDAMTSLYNAQASNTFADTILKGKLGAMYDQNTAESKERTKTYKFAGLRDLQHAQKAFYETLNEALDYDLIRTTGQRSTVGGNMAALSKLASRATTTAVGGGSDMNIKNITDFLKMFNGD